MATRNSDVVFDDFFDIVVEIERIGDTGSVRGEGDFDGFGVVLVKNDIIFAGLIFGDVGLCGEIIFVAFMDVEMIGFKMANNSDMRRLGKIPELETG